jgi:hypothetical protein
VVSAQKVTSTPDFSSQSSTSLQIKGKTKHILGADVAQATNQSISCNLSGSEQAQPDGSEVVTFSWTQSGGSNSFGLITPDVGEAWSPTSTVQSLTTRITQTTTFTLSVWNNIESANCSFTASV